MSGYTNRKCIICGLPLWLSLSIWLNCLLSLIARAQDNPDSLIGQLKHIRVDTVRVGMLCDISAGLSITNISEGLRYGRQALVEAERIGWERGIASANNVIGINHQNAAHYDSARNYYQNALNISEHIGDKLGMANAYNAIGVNYQSAGNLPEALRYELRALRLFEEINKLTGVATCYGNIGVLYDNQKVWSKAEINYNKALQLYRSLDNHYGVVSMLTNLGNLWWEMGNSNKALPIQLEALRNAESDSLSDLILLNLENIGNTFLSLGNFSSALSHKEKGLALARRYGNEEYIAFNTGEIGGLYLAAAKDSTGAALKELAVTRVRALQLAKAHLDTALDLLRGSNNYPRLYQFHYLRADVHELLGEGMAALADYKMGDAFEDSVINLGKRTQLENLETERALQLKDKQIELDKLAVEKKRNERAYFAAGIALLLMLVIFVWRERKRSERLLLNILPAKIAQRLKQREHPIADAFSQASILFIDMVNFTEFTRANDPKQTVNTLDEIFTRFDEIAERHGLEKIKTIGDCYMAVAGIPVAQADHAQRAADMALDAKESMAQYQTHDGKHVSFRIGIDCGSIVAGVIGSKKFIYDLWGEAVNTASRMESTGVTGAIHCTDNFRLAAGGAYTFVSRGITEIKGIGPMETWLLQGRKS